MGRWRVKRNSLPKIKRALPLAIDAEVDNSAEILADNMQPGMWRHTGLLQRITKSHPPGQNHAEVQVGYYLGQGFYSGFQEFGTVKQPARPHVAPMAHMFEPIYAKYMIDAVKKGVNP